MEQTEIEFIKLFLKYFDEITVHTIYDRESRAVTSNEIRTPRGYTEKDITEDETYYKEGDIDEDKVVAEGLLTDDYFHSHRKYVKEFTLREFFQYNKDDWMLFKHCDTGGAITWYGWLPAFCIYNYNAWGGGSYNDDCYVSLMFPFEMITELMSTITKKVDLNIDFWILIDEFVYINEKIADVFATFVEERIKIAIENEMSIDDLFSGSQNYLSLCVTY